MLSVKRVSSVSTRLLQLRREDLHRRSKAFRVEQHASTKAVKRKADPRVVALRQKLLYCDYLDLERVKTGTSQQRIKYAQKCRHDKIMEMRKLTDEPAYSILLNDASKGKSEEESVATSQEFPSEAGEQEWKPARTPNARTDCYQTVDSTSDVDDRNNTELLNRRYKALYENYLDAKNCILERRNGVGLEGYARRESRPKGELWKVPSDWMTDYEQYDDALLEEHLGQSYGSPNRDSKVSAVPCGGCGALLQCKDPESAGYLPSELFLSGDEAGLKRTKCQRCHFLKYYKAALEVKVPPDEYIELLKVIKTKKCAVVLIIDLTDFPCSIEPRIRSVLHPLTPVFLVGNKVDLLPRDSRKFFEQVKTELLRTVRQVTSIRQENIVDVQLVSAKTGYGIEELINKLQRKWRYKGDVYLIGCTNVGKSSMFNALLNSDYCKTQAVDLVQRATISPWPGTTLNLLKFPILNAVPKKLYLRTQRLVEERKFKELEKVYRDNQFRSTGLMKYATLRGHVGKTFSQVTERDERADPFSAGSHLTRTGDTDLDETRPEYRQSRWCYDTPGTIRAAQVLHLLTTDELMALLPKYIVAPRTFVFQPGETMFLGGVGRLDYSEGEGWIRCTLFASKSLPITMCRIVDADGIYEQLLKTEAFVVPVNDPERLKVWPALKSQKFEVTGIARFESAADVVLSSSGWIAVTPDKDQRVALTAWTPEGRGIYLRTPAVLRKSVSMRGLRIPGTPMYKLGRQVFVK